MPNFFYIFFLSLIAVNCKPTQNITTTTPESTSIENFKGKKPKNIILMIGDGMGLSQISAGFYNNNNTYSLEEFPIVGLVKTHSADNLVTDSAASATAMATGEKTYNNGIGIDKDGVPVKTILEEAEEKALMTGVVVTSSVVNATPAAFMAHQKLRAFSEPIAVDISNSGIDILIGGGKKYFDRRDSDERNLIVEMEAKGYQVSDYLKARKLKNVKLKENKKLVYFTADNDPLSHLMGRNYLPDASSYATQFLQQRADNGFFLLIEGSQIDWAGHASNAKFLLSEMKDFDKAIQKILAFAKADRETLVIVTADHETGGFAIKEGSKMNKLKTEFIGGRHTGTMVPLFAYGPGAELFSGIYDNTDVYHKMKEALNLK